MLAIVGKGLSARRLQSELDCLRFYRNREFLNGRWRSIRRNMRPDYLLHWGETSNLMAVREPVLNREIVFDKLTQLRHFHTSEIPAPQLFSTIPPFNETKLWLGRKRRHVGGTDILGPYHFRELCGDLGLGRADFGVEYINKTHEYRVHVFRGEVIRIARKVWDDTKGPQPASPAWNIDSGYKFRYALNLRASTKELLTDLGLRAIVALRMDFGAVDIVGRRGTNGRLQFWVLEVNSAPGIESNQNTVAVYVEAIRRWTNER